MKTRAILFTAPGQVAASDVEIPEPLAGEVLVETAFSAVSPGTELRCLAGKQAGTPDWPYIAGYSQSGRVAAVGEGVSLEVGIPVYCAGTARANVALSWGGHAAHAVRPEAEVFPLPEGADLVEASLGHLAAIAYRGVRLGQARPHETVANIGLGPIGMLSARLHAATGARVVAADLSPERVALAEARGVDAFVPEGPLPAAFRKVLPEGADVVVDSTGAPAVLPRAMEVAREKPWDDSAEPGPRLVVQGSYPGDVAVPYQDAFMKEMSLHFPRDVQPRDVRAVLDLMARGLLSARDVVTEVRSPEDASRTYAELREAPGKLMSVAFEWGRGR
jgi:2-desacetyl-2-hydroxyethyl bacteriochlorophyllide A dehydrogenase